MIYFFCITINLLIAAICTATEVTSEKMTSGHGVIWSMAEVASDKLIFTTRSGEFKVLNLKSKKVDRVKSDLKVLVQGQGGLLDVEVHPSFATNQRIYFTYSCQKEKSLNTTCLGHAKLDLLNLSLTDAKEIFSAQPAVDSSLHFGSRLTWDSENNLYMSTGDRYFKKDMAQSLQNHLGKILRLTDEGKAAQGNPFINVKDAKPEIFSYGHRNVQGLFYDKSARVLWESEHGAKGGDEINRIEAGKNYGWPVITHGVDYSGEKIGIGKEKAGLEQPAYFYVPSIAPSGLIVYSGSKFKQWKGHLFLGALVLEHINHVEMASPPKEKRLLTNLGERIRDITETTSGDIYFSTDSGKIFKFIIK